MIRLILSLLIIGSASCKKEKAVAPSATIIPNVTRAYNYLALGDSYTIGQSVGANERFPAQTIQLLRQQGISIADPVYIAQTGWTTINLNTAIVSQRPSPTYDIVTLLIGVNDQYQRMDTAGYAIRFKQLLDTAVYLAAGQSSHVFVLSIPDYSVTPFVHPTDKPRVRMEIDWFNEINKRITMSRNISYTDITTSTREATTNLSLIAADSLHPSGLEYKKWAELLRPKIQSAL